MFSYWQLRLKLPGFYQLAESFPTYIYVMPSFAYMILFPGLSSLMFQLQN